MSVKSGLARRIAYKQVKAGEPIAHVAGLVGQRYASGLAAANKKFGVGGMPAALAQQTGPRGGKFHITAGGTKSYTPLISTAKATSTPVDGPAGLMKVLPRPAKEQVEKHRASLLEPEKISFGESKALKMFTFGYDETIRAHQGGASDEALVKHRSDFLSKKGFEKDQRGDSAEEHVRKAKLAAASLDNFLEKAPKATEMPHVYRGIVTDKATAHRLMSATHFDMQGKTTSTSWDPAVAKSFVARYHDESSADSSHAIVLKMKHKSGVGIEHVSSVPVEKEVLLPGKAKFRVTKRYHDQHNPNFMVIEGEEV